jgi:type IV secretion system protein VirD4
MNATKVLWGQVLVVSAVVLAFLWGATEWVGWRLAFQPKVGHPWLYIAARPVYQPPAFFWWWFACDPYSRDISIEGAYIAASGGIAAVVVAVAMSVWRAHEVKRLTTYGSAHRAETSDVREVGLLDRDGILFGRRRHD